MSTRSRQGCDECRRRRRKCDEQKPYCGQCSAYDRSCRYTLRVVWGGVRGRSGRHGRRDRGSAACQPRASPPEAGRAPGAAPTSTAVRRHSWGWCGQAGDEETAVPQAARQDGLMPSGPSAPSLPRHLPNGIPLSPRYQRLLSHFTGDILASLSCHPSIHQDLRQGLVPVTLESPQLMSACLALSAAGFLSRGISSLDGVDMSKVLGHLQSSGLALLRSALATGQMSETLLATCLIWCLTEVFSYRQGGTSSWRVHLQGIRALLDANGSHRSFLAPSGAMQAAMKHLYQLYLSLRTLPYIPASEASTEPPAAAAAAASATAAHLIDDDSPTTEATEADPEPAAPSPSIDGFLGYSDELLDVIRQIDQLSRTNPNTPPTTSTAPTGPSSRPPFEADVLLGKLRGMIRRDARSPPAIVSIGAPLSPEYGREFALCHRIFQHATLLHLYRRLYRLPSGSPPVREAAAAVRDMLAEGGMARAQGRPCHTWVAMAMPLFNLGCEALGPEQRRFALDKVDKLEECIRSLHVGIIRQALCDVWALRDRMGDDKGELCASELLDKLDYNVVLF